MFSTSGDGRQVEVDLSVLAGEAAPQTLVAVRKSDEDYPLSAAIDYFSRALQIHQVRAAVLAAVIRAVADQVSSASLSSFGGYTNAYDLTLHQLAMSYRPGDTGVLGDTFEYAVMAAINARDPQVMDLLRSTLTLLGERGEIIGAATAAAENGRAQVAVPTLPQGARLLTGRRGRPPSVQRLLTQANTRDWKSDIFVCTDRGVVGATIKSNPAHMGRHLRQCRDLPYPPRFGIVPARVSAAGIVFDPTTGIPVVRLPIDVPFFALLSSTLSEVQAAFARRLDPPPPLHDPSGIGLVMHQWKGRTVSEFVDRLDEEALNSADLFVQTAPTQVKDLTGWETFGGGALVVADPLMTGIDKMDPWRTMARELHHNFFQPEGGFSLP